MNWASFFRPAFNRSFSYRSSHVGRIIQRCKVNLTQNIGYGIVYLESVLKPWVLKGAKTMGVKSKLSELRKERNLSQMELAKKLGVSRQTINALERQKYVPSLELALKIARFFDRRVEEIFELIEEVEDK